MRDKHDMPLVIGDEVYCFIPGGGQGHHGFIIGVMSYAKDDEIVCIASERYTGMPVNTGHLQRTGTYHIDAAMLLREMYLKQAPGAFKRRAI
jgi:hypothetical protein